MNWKTFDNIARFCYDCAKISFGGLVIGVLARGGAINWVGLLIGFMFTITLLGCGIVSDLTAAKEK